MPCLFLKTGMSRVFFVEIREEERRSEVGKGVRLFSYFVSGEKRARRVPAEEPQSGRLSSVWRKDERQRP
jgi:hypothetical protein